MRSICRNVTYGISGGITEDTGSPRRQLKAVILTFSAVAFAVLINPAFADGVNCHQVGGGILTNFIDPNGTDGIAIGDLRGAVGVAVLDVNGSVYHVHHHWVTETGDTIFLQDAFLTTMPTFPGQVGFNYLNGVNITGGTGRFAGATGTLAAWGAADLSQGKLTLRYQGSICFKPIAAN